ncbi:MAG: hypothetical protein NZ849_09675 [Meiothermus sp.]|uniref:hypothetical protein n=1 Tax=Meiothermus sp. TaxID=1955249 RepID=UPI0025E40EC7|nr:hypothetical protein [Meiothermus sp.]MCS7059297.1 hypothetical protein [Meiothermus sp.]MCS7195160.1 hypothetical protein [Meiothermus sp.]MCX7740973.1 hypothetical protein [Meiothermus sp.]MDW8091878.1 hypothetical protein [Meiothermus sp.]MDW8482117.1 hypothetical protein [Meiothermus sp.]
MRALLALLAGMGTAAAQSWGFQVALGLTLNAPVELRVVQQGYPVHVEEAHFEGRDFEPFPYYAARLWVGNPAGLRYELELIHQKLYWVGDGSGVVQQLNATDGFNYLLLNLAYGSGLEGLRLVPRLGLGVVIPHPESVVRNQAWGVDGDPRFYHLGGIGGQLALGVEIPSQPTALLEAKLTLSHSRLQIAEGYAEGFFKTLHALFGLGY